MKHAYSYTRVSTPAQGLSRLGLDAQQAQIDAFARASGFAIVKRYSEVASGKGPAFKRPVLREAVQQAIKLGLPIIVADMDRFGRDAVSLGQLLESPGFNLHVASLGIDSPPSRFER